MGERRVTLEDISKEINISRTTIYKVINDKGFVADKTKQRVLNTLKEYKYVQNKNARNLALNKSYSVAYVGFRSHSADYFHKIVNVGLSRAKAEFSDHGLTLIIREVDIADAKGQLEIIDVLYEEGIRDFIIAPCDTDIMCEKVEEMKLNGCSIIMLSRDVISDKHDSYVGIDYFKSGYLAAEVMGKILKKGKLQILVGDEIKVNRDIQYRYNGFLEKIKSYKDIEVTTVDTNLSTGKHVYDHVYETAENIQGIFDITYRLQEISKALIMANRAQDVKLVGFDLFEENSNFIETSVIDAIIFQDLCGQTYQAVKLFFDKLCYGKPFTKKKYYSRLDIIMSGNLEFFTQEYV